MVFLLWLGVWLLLLLVQARATAEAGAGTVSCGDGWAGTFDTGALTVCGCRAGRCCWGVGGWAGAESVQAWAGTVDTYALCDTC